MTHHCATVTTHFLKVIVQHLDPLVIAGHCCHGEHPQTDCSQDREHYSLSIVGW